MTTSALPLRFLTNPVDLSPLERGYAERVVQQRLHQPEFRARVSTPTRRDVPSARYITATCWTP